MCKLLLNLEVTCLNNCLKTKKYNVYCVKYLMLYIARFESLYFENYLYYKGQILSILMLTIQALKWHQSGYHSFISFRNNDR